MSDKTFKPKKGEEIIIRVPRGKKLAAGKPTATAKRKGIIKTRRPDDFLPRRLQIGGIKFFDFGQILIGDVWRTSPFVVAPAVDNPTSNPSIRNLTGDDYSDRDAALNLDDAALLGAARRIEKAHGELFRIKVSGTGFTRRTLITDAAWTSGGLKLTPEELGADNFNVAGMETNGLSEYQSNRYFQQIRLTGAGKNHITGVFDFSAAAVSFAPGKSDSYYLIPTFVKLEALLIAGVNPFVKLGFIYSFFPRFPDAPGTKIDFNTLAVPSSCEAEFIEAANAAVNRPNVKAFELVGGVYSPYPVEDFPLGYTAAGATVTNQSQVVPSGSLAAIIRQGDSLFYVWK